MNGDSEFFISPCIQKSWQQLVFYRYFDTENLTLAASLAYLGIKIGLHCLGGVQSCGKSYEKDLKCVLSNNS